MKLWNKIKSKFAKKEKDFNNYDVNDSDFIDPALRDQLPEFVNKVSSIEISDEMIVAVHKLQTE